MRNWFDDTGYMIGTTEVGMLRLKDINVPAPDQSVIGYSAYSVRADSTRVGDGFLQCQWIWDIISRESLRALLAFLSVSDSDTYKNVYISTDARNGVTVMPDFITYSAVMYVPILTGSEGVSVARSPYSYQSVKITFNKLVEAVTI